jgi:hypothetical protein
MDRKFWMSPVLFWLGFVLLGTGFVVSELWRGIELGPTLFLSELLAASLILAFVLCRILRCAKATALLLLWLLALGYFAGFAACVAVLLIALAAMGIGTLLVPVEVPARGALAVLAGLALLGGIDGWLLPFRVHFRAVYVAVLVIIVLLRLRTILPMLRVMPTHWNVAVAAAPGMAVLALVAIGALSTFAWQPTLDFDSLAYHLNLPSQLVKLGYYQMNAGSNIWAISPWFADVLQAIGWMIGGIQARGAVDALWATLSLVLIWKLCEELELRPSLRWLAVALYASIPMIAYTLSTMQTEGPTAAVIAALALVIQHARVPSRRNLMLAAALFGLLLALKVSNLIFAGPLGLWLLWRWSRQLPWSVVPFALLLALVIAGSSYFYAWTLTGNPVLPVFNGIFHSSYFAPINYQDSRWSKGFHWDIIWRLVFHSTDYVEGGDATPIFVLIGLGGSLVVALFRPFSRPLAMVAIAGLLLPLYEIQYSRYAQPALALLIPAMLCGVPLIVPRCRQNRATLAALCALVVLSLIYINGSSWQQKAGVLQELVTHGRATVIDKFAPVRRMVQVVEDRYGETARVLILDEQNPFAAEFAGRAFVLSWYDPQLQHWTRNADADDTGRAWTAVFAQVGANFLMTAKDKISLPLMAAIDKADGSIAYETSNSILWQLRNGEAGVAESSNSHAISVTFDTSTAPPAQTLLDANVMLRCNPDIAREGHIVVSWQIEQQDHPSYSKYMWAPCLQNGTAHASIHMAIRYKVLAIKFLAQPEPSLDMGLAAMKSYATLRRDLTAERDLSGRAREVLEFKPNSQPAVQARR